MVRCACQCTYQGSQDLTLACKGGGLIKVKNATAALFAVGTCNNDSCKCRDINCVHGNGTYVTDRTNYWSNICDGNTTCSGEVKFGNIKCTTGSLHYTDHERVYYKCEQADMTTLISETSTDTTSSTGAGTGAVIGGVIGGVLLLVVIVVIGIILWKKKSRATKKKDNTDDHTYESPEEFDVLYDMRKNNMESGGVEPHNKTDMISHNYDSIKLPGDVQNVDINTGQKNGIPHDNVVTAGNKNPADLYSVPHKDKKAETGDVDSVPNNDKPKDSGPVYAQPQKKKVSPENDVTVDQTEATSTLPSADGSDDVAFIENDIYEK